MSTVVAGQAILGEDSDAQNRLLILDLKDNNKKTTPNIETERFLINRIITWRQEGKPGYWKVQCQVEGPDGGKPFFCDLDDLKVETHLLPCPSSSLI
jgi:hypothetical protein